MSPSRALKLMETPPKKTQLLKELIEHDPELRDVLRRRTYVHAQITSCAELADQLLELQKLYREGTLESLSELLRRLFDWELVRDPHTNMPVLDTQGNVWSQYVDQHGQTVLRRLILLAMAWGSQSTDDRPAQAGSAPTVQ